MTLPKVGTKTSNQGVRGTRDAFHVPGVLVTSEYTVFPGQPVRFEDKAYDTVIPVEKDLCHAIADPFGQSVAPGDVFWVFLDPTLGTKVRHDFGIGVNTEKVSPKPNFAPEGYISREDCDDLDDGCRGCY